MQLPFNESLIIIPTYNEVENIDLMICTIFDLYPEVNVLIVEDGSPDGTGDLIRKKMEVFPNLHIIERSKKLGLGTAYIVGFKFALEHNFNFIFGMDCDFSHDPKDIKSLLESALNYDLVIGSRYIQKARVIDWPLKRLALSKLASHYTRLISKIPLQDTTGGFKCFNRKVLELINLNEIISTGYIFQFELNYMAWNNGVNIIEVPIIFHERKYGKSKMESKIIIEAFFNVLIISFKDFWNDSKKG